MGVFGDFLGPSFELPLPSFFTIGDFGAGMECDILLPLAREITGGTLMSPSFNCVWSPPG